MPGVSYDGEHRLFHLQCKTTLYAFRVDDNRNLEHLYWGPTLPPEDDISYLTRSHVPAPFDPAGYADLADKLGLEELKDAEIVDNLSESWRVFTRQKDVARDESAKLRARRLENASWRLWNMDRKKVGGSDPNKDYVEASRSALGTSLQMQTPISGRSPHLSSSPSPSPSSASLRARNAPLDATLAPAVWSGDRPLSATNGSGQSHSNGSTSSTGADRSRPPKRVGSAPSLQESELVASNTALSGFATTPVLHEDDPATEHLASMEGGGRDMVGLDLDGHHGDRQAFRLQLASRFHDGIVQEEGANARSPVATKPVGGAPDTLPTNLSAPSFSQVARPSAGLGGFGSAEVLTGLRSPGGGLVGRGMGSRKPSFAVALDTLDPAMSCPDSTTLAAASSTNWAKLDPEVVGKSSKLLEFSDHGTGDFREPSIKLRYDRDGSTVSPLQYCKHRILRGKPDMPHHIPSIYTESADEATTLCLELTDPVTQLKVILYYTVFHDYDVITRRSVVVNDSDQTVCLTHLASSTVDFDAESRFYMTQLSGGWARERQIVTRKLDDGVTVVKSQRGASSHQFNPFLVITPDREPNETDGECFAFCLVYSGNFMAAAEFTEYRRLRVNMGINPEGFNWHLDPPRKGEPASQFHSPEVVMCYSNEGMGHMSRQMHRLFRERLCPRQWRYKIPPVLLNTWEAAYFEVSHDVVVDIARKAVLAGIELLVLDDGWFGTRNDTYSGLGDWKHNPKKLPKGLKGLAEEVNQIGLKFGIWVEPEMVSTNSDLYRAHPDWCLHVPARPLTVGRNQLVLDFSRADVRENIFEQLRAMLESANIEYVKWDMNRHLTEVFSQAEDASRQGEIVHRYMLGVYEVFGRITSAFPHVLFESCSGGGGRFDAGMLYFSPQIWASDNTDALSRVKIQHGTSLAYPASSMGAHVSTVPNHQTLRSTTSKTRSLVAMAGTYGYELDPREMTDDDIKEIRKFISIQKLVAPLVYTGDMYRLWSPFNSDSSAWMFLSRAKDHAFVIAVNMRREVGRLEPRLKFQDLIPSAMYSVKELCPGTMVRNPHTSAIEHDPRGVYQFGPKLVLSGFTLCRAGLPIKFMFDADSVLIELRIVQGGLGRPM